MKITKLDKSSDNTVNNWSLRKVTYIKLLGYLLMMIGLALPLYAFTSLSINQLQVNAKYKQYRTQGQLNTSNAIDNKTIERYNQKVNSTKTNIIDPFIVEGYKARYDFLKKDPDQVFAYLVIPAINLAKPIRLDATQKHLAKGLAQVDGTALPVGGVGNRSVVAGHRGRYEDVLFLNIGDLKTGDKVYIDRAGSILTYEVKDKEIITPSQWEKLRPVKNKDMLTLLSCHPKTPPSPYRLLVNCERVETKPSKGKQRSAKVTSAALATSLRRSSSSTQWTNAVIYSITVIGWLLLIVLAAIFFKVLVQKDSTGRLNESADQPNIDGMS